MLDYGLLFGADRRVGVRGRLVQPEPAAGAAEPEPSAASDSDRAGDSRAGSGRYARYAEVEARLAQLMAARSALYREPALTIGQVAKRSGYPEYLVSAVINRRLGGSSGITSIACGWRRCVRGWPIRAETRTILDIAYDCGFTSKSTFNAAFKRQVGETPSGYRRRHAAAGPAAVTATAA